MYEEERQEQKNEETNQKENKKSTNDVIKNKIRLYETK